MYNRTLTQRQFYSRGHNSSFNLVRPLLPQSNQQLRMAEQYRHTLPQSINPDILHVINDKAFLSSKPTFQQQLIILYKKVNFIIRPDNMKLIAWYFLIVTIFMYYLIQMGLLLAFGSKFWKDELQYMTGVQIFFIVVLAVDMLISPIKAYYSEGILIKDVVLIYRQYKKIQFFLDLLSVLVILIPLASRNVYSNWIKILFFAKVYSINKISDEFQRITQLYIIPNTIYLVTKLVILSIFYAHFMNVFFYLVGLYVYNTNYYGPNTPMISWIYNSWAFYQMAFLEWYRMYAYIMYCGIAFVTTIAYGDVTPKNPLECIFIIWAFITQSIFWGYLLSQMLRLLINVYAYNFDRRYHHFALNYKLKKENISDGTFRKVQRHTEQIDQDQQYRNRDIQDEILQLLPEDPLYGLLLVIHKDSLKEIGFDFAPTLNYKSIGPAHSKSIFLQNFMKQIKEERHFAGDLFYTTNERQNQKLDNHCAYYFINQSYAKSVVLGIGKLVEISLEVDQDSHTLTEQEGCYILHHVDKHFGDIQFLTGEERNHWAICSKNCLMFKISRRVLTQFYYLLSLQEKEYVALNVQTVKGRQCWICENSHNFMDCNYVFAINRVYQEQNEKAIRSRNLHAHNRSRFKTKCSWKFYPEIKQTKVKITHHYKRKIFYQSSAQDLYIDLQLQENLEEEEQLDIQHQILQTEAILNNLYQHELEEAVDHTLQDLNYDYAYNFQVYKPEFNIQNLCQVIQKRKEMELRRRSLIRIKMS